MPDILHSNSLQKRLDEDGIISFPFLPEETVEALQTLFQSNFPEFPEQMKTGFYFSAFATKEKRKELSDKAIALIQPFADTVFKDHKILVGIFQVKGLGEESEVILHQDLTVVDESIFNCYTLWVPLNNSVKQNGAIYAIPGSQLTMRSFRAHTILTLFEKAREVMKKKLVLYEASAGNALLFNKATVHYSPPNKSNTPRLSIAFEITSKEAKLQIGYKNPEDAKAPLEIYSVPDNFWLLYNDLQKERLERPAFGKKISETTTAVTEQYDEQEFNKRYAAIPLKIRLRSFLNRKLNRQL